MKICMLPVKAPHHSCCRVVGKLQGLHGEGPGPQEQRCCMMLGRRGDPGDPGLPVEVFIKISQLKRALAHEQQVRPSECRPVARAVCPGQSCMPDHGWGGAARPRHSSSLPGMGSPLWIKWEGACSEAPEGDNKGGQCISAGLNKMFPPRTAVKMGQEVQWGHGRREGRPMHPCVGRAWFRSLVALVASPNVHRVPGVLWIIGGQAPGLEPANTVGRRQAWAVRPHCFSKDGLSQ